MDEEPMTYSNVPKAKKPSMGGFWGVMIGALVAGFLFNMLLPAIIAMVIVGPILYVRTKNEANK